MTYEEVINGFRKFKRKINYGSLFYNSRQKEAGRSSEIIIHLDLKLTIIDYKKVYKENAETNYEVADEVEKQGNFQGTSDEQQRDRREVRCVTEPRTSTTGMMRGDPNTIAQD
ncbi:hypothetical protein EVAR_37526_1 [Eumeta japonica]|uniref:Uncharacterized protein n=1 Tax=Eumeta variegata TaxID=151549 RepID=A0A4C1XBM1_EUMVA|nr:hypothetical protein EVAR_37526_1 [Eumeta japonica]